MTGPGHEDEAIPLGFKVIVVLAGLYLAWRGIEAIGWLIGRLT